MASLDFTVKLRFSPDQETMDLILKLLDMWQDAHPDQMVAMVPQKDRYGYEIINRRNMHEQINHAESESEMV